MGSLEQLKKLLNKNYIKLENSTYMIILRIYFIACQNNGVDLDFLI